MGSEKLPTQNQEACERIILRISKTAASDMNLSLLSRTLVHFNEGIRE